jgi:hypothetical protein
MGPINFLVFSVQISFPQAQRRIAANVAKLSGFSVNPDGCWIKK